MLTAALLLVGLSSAILLIPDGRAAGRRRARTATALIAGMDPDMASVPADADADRPAVTGWPVAGPHLARVWTWWRGDAPPSRPWWLAVALGLVLAMVGMLLSGLVAAAVLACGGALFSRAVLRGRWRRRVARTQQAAVESVAVLAAELRAGKHPARALQLAAQSSRALPALRAAAAISQWGGDVAAVLAVVEHGDARAGRCLAAAWTVAETSGAALADTLSAVEDDLRAAAEVRAEASAELAGSRATACLLAGLPILGLLLGAGLGARPLQVLLHTPTGALCTALAAAFEAAGLAWVARLAAGAERRL